jgi:hypothetical protein
MWKQISQNCSTKSSLTVSPCQAWYQGRRFIVLIFTRPHSHNLRSHQKIRHAEYQGEGVTITQVRKSRSSANASQTSFNIPSHSQTTSSLIISPPPPPNILNLNTSDIKNNLPVYKSDWNLMTPRWGVLGGNNDSFCWFQTCWGIH